MRDHIPTAILLTIAVHAACLIVGGCKTTGNRIQAEIDRLPWREDAPDAEGPTDVPAANEPDAASPALPAEPPVVELPAAELPAAEVISEMQWFERDGRAVLRIKAAFSPRGYSLITAHGHKDVDPRPPMTESQWLAANNARPPQRVADGYAEWVLDRSCAEIAAAAQAYGRSSGPVIMVFSKCNVGGQVAFWVHPAQQYGTIGGRAPVKNIDNTGWQVEL
jgi:hypothetical protein